MSDIHYIKIIARNIETLSQRRMTPSKGIIQVFLSGTGAPNYRETPTFSVLIKHLKENPKSNISCFKIFISEHIGNNKMPFGHNKRFVTCKTPGYAFERLPKAK